MKLSLILHVFQDIVIRFMNSKLKNTRYTTKQNLNRSIASNRGTINNNETEGDMDAVSERQKTAIEFLKSAMVNEENMETIKEKLKFTLSYRLEMMKTPELDVLETFPYFFTNPELVRIL